MSRREVLGIQAARLALAELLGGIDDPLARDRLGRVEAILSRVAADLGRRAEFDAAPRATSSRTTAIADASRRILDWETEVAAFEARPVATEATDDSLARRIAAYLTAKYPEAPPLVEAVRRMPGGRSKQTVMLDLADHAFLPRAIVLRTDSSRTLAEDSVSREFPAIEAIHRTGFPIPTPLWFEADPEVLGAPFIAFAHASGKPAGNLWGAYDRDGAAARELAGALARLHAICPTTIPGGQSGVARDSVAALFAGFNQRWHASRPDESPVITAAFAWLDERLDQIDGESVIVHGDAHFSNMLMDGETLTALLDWEFWHFGHPAEDLAYCRPYVEETLDWQEFLGLYVAAGGRRCDPRVLDLFAVWRPLRNAVLAAGVAHDFVANEDIALETAAIALATYPRLVAQLAQALLAAAVTSEGAT